MSLATVCGCVRAQIAEHGRGTAPITLGHEGVGIVVAVGAGARSISGGALQPGQRIVWLSQVACGACARCRAGRRDECRAASHIGAGADAGDLLLSGTFGSHLLLPAGTAVEEVPAWAPDALVAPAGCAVARAAAALDRLGPVAGQRVGVMGAGLVGLAAAAIAAERGAASCVLVDPDPVRRSRALAFGADLALDVDVRAPACDAVIVTPGAGAGARAALSALGRGGVLALLGPLAPGAGSVDLAAVARAGWNVVGVRGLDPRHLVTAVDVLVSTHAVRPWTSLVAAPVPLERAATALLKSDAAASRTSLVP